MGKQFDCLTKGSTKNKNCLKSFVSIAQRQGKPGKEYLSPRGLIYHFNHKDNISLENATLRTSSHGRWHLGAFKVIARSTLTRLKC